MILVDSDVLIAHLRGLEVARDWLRDARSATGSLAISVVTLVEVTGGMRSTERRAVWRLLDAMRIDDVTEVVARRAGEFMREHRAANPGIGLGDYLTAATAEVKGRELATLNVKHFPMFEGLQPAFRLG